MENICIEDRKKLKIVGATRVVSATDNVIITGTNMEVTKLDLDNKEVCFSGTINSLKYAQKAEKGNLIKRLFK